jgi:hypothetical protein
MRNIFKCLSKLNKRIVGPTLPPLGPVLIFRHHGFLMLVEPVDHLDQRGQRPKLPAPDRLATSIARITTAGKAQPLAYADATCDFGLLQGFSSSRPTWSMPSEETRMALE